MIAPTLVFTQLVLNVPVGRSQLIDVNQDGYLDLVVEGRVYTRQGDGSYQAERVYENASFVMWGDLDNDGRLDAVVIRRKGTSTVQLGDSVRELEPAGQNTVAGALADLDRDGRLELGLANSYVEEGKSLEAEPLRVYWDFRPRELTRPGPPGAAGAARPLFGLSACDLDNDGYPELLGAAYGRQWNVLYQRHGEGYAECAARYGLDGDEIRHGRYPDKQKRPLAELPFRANGNTFCLAPADFDGDGDWDVFSSEITHSWAGDSSDLSALLINRLERFKEPFLERQIEIQADPETGFQARPGLGLHRDHSPQTPARWNQGDLQAHWADLNNDGNLDLLVCESDYPHNRLRVWLQNDQHGFTENHDLKFNNCPGAAVGDVDRDGDLDLVTTGTRTRWPEARPQPELVLWTNQTRAPGLNLRLIGRGDCNRSAIGARVYLTTDRGRQSREVQGTYGHWGQQTEPGEVHFGLGQAVPQELRIVWPDPARTETVLKNPRGRWLVVEPQGLVHADEVFQAGHWRGDS